jgi:hypothetical protein
VVVVVVVDTLSPSASLDGVPGVTVRPEPALDYRCHRTAPFPAILMSRGGRFRSCADGAPARPCSDRWREAELSACCIAAALSSAVSCWHTRLSSEVATSGQLRSNMATAARFCDACLNSDRASLSVLASTFAPSLVHRSLLRVCPRAGGVRVRARGCSGAG